MSLWEADCLSGPAVVTSLTGIDVYAALFLTLLGVCAYVRLGDLRATFLCDCSHALILMVIILYFMFEIYSQSALIGSPRQMFEILKTAVVTRPVEGNEDGSYMIMKFNHALVFGIIQLCSGSGTVCLDQPYWQRAIASRPTTAVRAYISGVVARFTIPFGFATTLGLAAQALTENPKFSIYPNALSASDISAGPASNYAASTPLGKNGAVALFITLFMAVTRYATAEATAVSGIMTFDVYKTNIKPHAAPRQMIHMAHMNLCLSGVTMAIFACI